MSATAGAGNAPLLSVNLMPDGPIGRVVEVAALAEQIGCRRCWVYDEGLFTRDVYVTLAAIATATERVLLGPGITNPYVRHPAATATAVASLDELSGGRAFLGLGAGGGLTLDPLAIDRQRPLTTVAAMIADLRRLFAGETVTRADLDAYKLDRARLGYGRADIEIMLAGRGPRMLELGASAADGFYFSYIHKALLGSAVEELRAGAGDRPFTITYATMVATTDADIEVARAQLSFRLVDSPPEVRDLIGMTDRDVAAIRSALADGGPTAAAAHIRPEWVGDFVLTGSPAEAAAELRGLMAANGIDEFLLPTTDPDSAADQLEALAPHLLADPSSG